MVVKKIMSLICILIPVYNVESHIKRCLDSILCQTFQDFEVILVDDGSNDQSGLICDGYARVDNRINVIHQKYQGVASARNAALDWAFTKSESEWITFIDSDDWVHPCYLEALLLSAEKFSSEISACFYEECGDSYQFKSHIIVNNRLFNTEDFFCSYPGVANVAWGKIYKKTLFHSLRYPNGRIHEDTMTTYKIIFKFDSIPVVTTPLYAYYKNIEGIIHSQWNIRRLDAFRAYDEQIKFLKKNNYIRALEYVVNRAILLSAETITQHLTNKEKKEKKWLKKRLRKYLRKYKCISHFQKDSWVYELAYPVLFKILAQNK